MHSPNASKSEGNENAAKTNYDIAENLFNSGRSIQDFLKARTYVNLSINYQSNQENNQLLNLISAKLKDLGYTL